MEPSDKKFLPYGRQHVAVEDIEAVVKVLKSDWLTQGPVIEEFEDSLADTVGATHVVACSSGTAALHLAMLALGAQTGDRVITSANTFLADANCARYVGADIAFADIDPDTGNISVDSIAALLEQKGSWKRQVIIPVHLAGQPADLAAIFALAETYGAIVADDACHALGATYDHASATCRIGGGDHSAMTMFSFHPVKHVAAGEGGAIATSDPILTERLRRFRNHGINRDVFEIPAMALDSDGQTNPWYYEMVEPGFNYRLTDIQAALGCSQLDRLAWSVRRRNEVAFNYHRLIEQVFASDGVRPLRTRSGVVHAYHLFTVAIDFERFGVTRATVMNQLRQDGIGTQVHYIPVPLQPYYRKLLGTTEGDFPGAEKYYATALSLPMYPGLTENDVTRVVDSLKKALTDS